MSSFITRVKFQEKILEGHLKGSSKFIMSFMGSSVTAGHDTAFNISFSELTGQKMNEVLPFFNINAISRNVALGNNPCVPYDLCVKAFAGDDADLVHWEQTYNCGGGDQRAASLFETFVRLSYTLSQKPVIVFSDSSTPNWNAEDCKDGHIQQPPPLSDAEKKILHQLDSNPKEIARDQLSLSLRRWGALSRIVSEYKSQGIQLWNHDHYESYKCYGPYIPEWKCCSASWHPSVLGHELRAAHHSFFWLLVFKDALKSLKELSAEGKSAAEIESIVKNHLKLATNHFPTKPLLPSRYSDELNCYTSFQPRTENSLSLEGLRLPSGGNIKDDFRLIIFEELGHKGVLEKARERGYRDFKYMLYGNKDSGALSLRVTVKTSHKAFLCQPPGNWGKYPDGMKNFWEIDTRVYLSQLPSGRDFEFDENTATKLLYTQKSPTNSQEWLCVEFDTPLPLGEHVLTIVPMTHEYVAFSYLLIP
jgi:hypothetical protein